MSETTKITRPTWPGLVEAKRRAIRDAFKRPSEPEWVRRIEAARPQVEAVESLLAQRKLDQAIADATAYAEALLWQHSQGEHRDSVSGPHPDCAGCEVHLAPDVLLREHRGW